MRFLLFIWIFLLFTASDLVAQGGVRQTLVIDQPEILEIKLLEQIELTADIPSIIEVDVLGGVEPYYYQWEPESFFDDPTSGSPLLTASSSTAIKVTATDARGCNVALELEVLVSIPLSRKPIKDPNISIYPVPSNGVLNIEVPYADTYLLLHRLNGKLLFKTDLEYNSNILNLPHKGIFNITILRNSEILHNEIILIK